jgi:hypothetical protein
MKGSGLTDGPVSLVGNFGGIYGIWSEPSTNPNNAMTAAEPLADSIYTITMNLDSIGIYAFKFFKGVGWVSGEWDGAPDRTVEVLGDTTFATFYFGVKPGTESIGENPLAGEVTVYPVPYNNFLTIETIVDLKSIIVTSVIGQQVMKMDNVEVGTITLNTSELPKGLYFVTFLPNSGIPYTLKTMKY